MQVCQQGKGIAYRIDIPMPVSFGRCYYEGRACGWEIPLQSGEVTRVLTGSRRICQYLERGSATRVEPGIPADIGQRPAPLLSDTPICAK